MFVDYDWETLRAKAFEMTKLSYAPYSNFHVGAAAYTADGRIVAGCNVENGSLGTTLCAECSMVSELISTGGGILKAFVCVMGEGDLCDPCGRCRQVMYEHGGPDMLVFREDGPVPLSAYLPYMEHKKGPHREW